MFQARQLRMEKCLSCRCSSIGHLSRNSQIDGRLALRRRSSGPGRNIALVTFQPKDIQINYTTIRPVKPQLERASKPQHTIAQNHQNQKAQQPQHPATSKLKASTTEPIKTSTPGNLKTPTPETLKTSRPGNLNTRRPQNSKTQRLKRVQAPLSSNTNKTKPPRNSKTQRFIKTNKYNR